MTVAVTSAAEGFPRRAFTVEDVGRMIDAGVLGEDEKFELIEGEIVMMAAKGIAHERIKSALNIAVVRALPDHLTVGVEVTLRLTSSSILKFEFISGSSAELVGPGVNDGMAVEFIHGSHDASLEFLLGCDADVAQH